MDRAYGLSLAGSSGGDVVTATDGSSEFGTGFSKANAAVELEPRTR